MNKNRTVVMTGVAGSVEHAEATLSVAKEQALQALKEIEELQNKLKHVRGTREITPLKLPKVEEPKELPLPARIENALRKKVMTLGELSKALGEPTGKLVNEMKAMRKNLYNMGTPDRTRYTWRIGDNTSADELTALLHRLVTEMPMTTAELVAATGARVQRVGGSMIEIQRSDARVMNMGNRHRFIWFVMPTHAMDAKLPPKGKSGS